MFAVLLILCGAAPPPPSPAGVEYARIRGEHLKREAELLRILEETQKALGELEDRTTERHLALAKKYPDDPGTYPALEQLVLDFTPHAGLALDLIARHHLGSARLGRLCLFLVEVVGAGGEKTEALLRDAHVKSPHPEVRGQAGLALAQLLAARPGRAKEAVKVLGAVVGRYARLRLPRTGDDEEGLTLGEVAGPMLFDLSRLAVGMKVPEIDGRDTAGKAMRLSATRGKVTLLVFWSPGVSNQELLPRVEALRKKLGGRLEVVGVMDDELEILPKTGPSWRSFKGGAAVAAAWNVRGWPALFLMDHAGVIRHRWPGNPGAGELEKAAAGLLDAARK